MPTIRTPINRSSITHITPRAVEIFRKMQATVDHDAWQKLHSALHSELALKTWQWPAIAEPDDVNVYPASSAGGEWFPKAQALYLELEAKIG